MQNMVYIKRHAKSGRTSFGDFETVFKKNEKSFKLHLTKEKSVLY